MDTAWQKSQATQRALVLVATSEDCLFCERLKHTTLRDPTVQSEIEQSFVLATIKATDQPSLMQRLKITTFPTTIVISPKGRVLAIMHGFVPPDRFRARLALLSSSDAS
jgi:protein disulfide-isomerase